MRAGRLIAVVINCRKCGAEILFSAGSLPVIDTALEEMGWDKALCPACVIHNPESCG